MKKYTILDAIKSAIALHEVTRRPGVVFTKEQEAQIREIAKSTAEPEKELPKADE